jgi:hypothetical protein
MEEVGAFGWFQLESAGDRGQNLGRDPDVPTLLEPGVPGEADSGEVGDLLAAQARCAAALTVLAADGRRRDAGPAVLEEVAQLGPGGSGTTRIIRHLVTNRRRILVPMKFGDEV